MALDFTKSPYLTTPASIIGTDEGTHAMWCEPDVLPSNTGTDLNYFLADVDGPRHTFLKIGVPANQIEAYNDGRDIYFDCTGAWTTGALTHFAFVYKKTGNIQLVYVNGTALSVAVAATGTWGSTAVGTSLWIGSRITGNFPWDGRMAEFGHWNAALDASEIAALAKGYAPSLIRPTSLTSYIPMVQSTNDLRGNTITTTGSLSAASHCRVIQPRRRKTYSFTAAAAATGHAMLVCGGLVD